MRVVSKYEVACPSCKVSYPPGQKRCVHCGGKTTKSFVEMPDETEQFADVVGHVEPEPAPMMAGEGHEMVFLPRDASGDGDADAPSGGILRRLGGLVWIVLFVVLTAIRMCAEE